MGYKVFVSYKFYDYGVQSLPNSFGLSLPGDYVQYLNTTILPNIGCIYKGEHQDEDLSGYSDDYIWQHLKDKIYDSSITILLISPNMKEPFKWDRSQWIPWELAFSLRETTRNDRTSHNNAILAVKLPDTWGYYYYFDKNKTFSILKSNIDNGYIPVVEWGEFIVNPKFYMDYAFIRRGLTDTDQIVKTI